MKCTCSKCGTQKTVEPRNLRRTNKTPETYVCLECARKNRHPLPQGPQTQLNRLKEWSEGYKWIHSGCFAGRD